MWNCEFYEIFVVCIRWCLFWRFFLGVFRLYHILTQTHIHTHTRLLYVRLRYFALRCITWSNISIHIYTYFHVLEEGMKTCSRHVMILNFCYVSQGQTFIEPEDPVQGPLRACKISCHFPCNSFTQKKNHKKHNEIITNSLQFFYSILEFSPFTTPQPPKIFEWNSS